MKTLKLLACAWSGLLLIATQSLAAQAEPDRDWSVSLLGGVGAARLSAENESTQFESESRQATALGVQLAWRFADRWGASAGFVRAFRSSRTTAVTGTPQPEVDIRTLYTDIPLLAHFRITERPSVRIDALAGPVFSWSDAGDVFLRQTGEQIAVLELNQRETSVLVGAEATFALRFPLFVRLQYQAGLTDATIDQAVRSRAFTAVAGVKLLRW